MEINILVCCILPSVVNYNRNQCSGVLQLAKCCNCLHSLDTAGTAEWVAWAIWRPTDLVPSLCQSHIGNTAFFTGNLAPSLRLSLSPYALSLLSCFSLCSVVNGCLCSSLLFPLLLGLSSASSSVSSSSCSCALPWSHSPFLSFSLTLLFPCLLSLSLSLPSSLLIPIWIFLPLPLYFCILSLRWPLSGLPLSLISLLSPVVISASLHLRMQHTFPILLPLLLFLPVKIPFVLARLCISLLLSCLTQFTILADIEMHPAPNCCWLIFFLCYTAASSCASSCLNENCMSIHNMYNDHWSTYANIHHQVAQSFTSTCFAMHPAPHSCWLSCCKLQYFLARNCVVIQCPCAATLVLSRLVPRNLVPPHAERAQAGTRSRSSGERPYHLEIRDLQN